MGYPPEISPPDASDRRRRVAFETTVLLFFAIREHKPEFLTALRACRTEDDIRKLVTSAGVPSSEHVLEFAWIVLGTWNLEPDAAAGLELPSISRYEPDYRIPARDNVDEMIAQLRAAHRARTAAFHEVGPLPRDLDRAVEWFVRHRLCGEKQEAIAAAARLHKSMVSTAIKRVAALLELSA